MTESEKPKLVVIVGPTASGKTGIAIQLAKQFSGEVISADSRQVYKQLDIGTEKITPDEMDGVTHHLIDMVDVETIYTAIDFKRDAEQALREIMRRNHVPIIAGGTFFYTDVLLGRIATPEVAPDPQLRSYLEDMSAEALHHSLTELDPIRAFDIDPHNKRRLIRALEIVKALGKVPKTTPLESPYEVLTLGIKTDRKELRARIRARAEHALSRGLVDETKKLLAQGVSRDRLSEIGLEYRLVLQFLANELTETELTQKLEEKIWQYAKRQLVWLRRDKNIQWFERDQNDLISKCVQSFLSI